jgi:hypothetical protein
MAQRPGPLRQDRRPRAKTPAERADEAADVQRRLKREAAERRAAADRSSPTGRPPGKGRTDGRRPTP